MVLLDARPDGVSVVFRRGTARNVPFQWPLGALAGRTFTATLDGVPLTVNVAADLLTVSVTVAQTTAAAAGPLLFELVETTGVDQPILVGTWFASDRPAQVTPPQTLTVTQNTDTVQVLVVGGTDLPEIASSDPAKVSVVTANGITTLGVDKTVPEFARLTADSSPVNNSTALVDASGLAVPVSANAIYLVVATVFYSSATLADLLMGWTAPAGSTGLWTSGGVSNSIGAAAGESALKVFTADWAGSLSVGGSGVADSRAAAPQGTLITGGTAGNLQFRFAQNAADVSNTVLRAHSMLVAQRVA